MCSLVQCVPNFSEGRNAGTVRGIVDAAVAASNARVIDFSSDCDHNRSVLTILGAPEEVRASVFAAAEVAVKSIDMNSHTGVHPRIGAVDVVPFVPVAGVTVEDCIALSQLVGLDFAEKLGIPVYFYENSALREDRRRLADIRRGGYELLKESGLKGNFQPDLGPLCAHPTAGAVAVGARGPLVAFNVNLMTDDIETARSIVRSIRSGKAGFEGVRAIAVPLASKGMTQVSMNITKPDLASVFEVFSFVEKEARCLGVEVAESEIIGALLRRFLGCDGVESVRARDFKDSQIIDNWM